MWWEKLRTSFWFVPSVMIGAALALSALTLYLDHRTNDKTVLELPLVFRDGVEGARSVLNSVVTAMITVTGVTFSVVIVAFTLASSQFTPRLLRNFMRDLGNQVVLGVFLGTFTFSLCILRVVGGPTGDFIPRISVTCGLLLSAASLVALVYFIHHAAAIIQAQSIIADVGRELDHAIADLYPDDIGKSGPPADETIPADFEEKAITIKCDRSDYLEAIDGDGLMELAVRHDLIFAAQQRPGEFIGKGEILLLAYPPESLCEEVTEAARSAFILGPQRTQTQDPEFVLAELVEIAVRALSPGINDPATAVQCVDRLGAVLSLLAERPIPSSTRFDDAGRLRLVTRHHRFDGLANAAFDQIRQYGSTSVPVTIRLLETLRRIAFHVHRDEDRETLLRHAMMIERGSKSLPEELDRADIERRFKAVIDVLNSSRAVGTGAPG